MIKFYTRKFTAVAALALSATGFAQSTAYSNIENVSLGADGIYNGKDGAGSFTSGYATYRSGYNTQYNYWSSGFAATNHTDNTTEGYTNIYSSYFGKGANGSEKYVVGQQGAIVVTGHKFLKEVQISNSTYAALSMKNGDSFAKKFGGATGNDPDYFRLVISGYVDGHPTENKVTFYLADFRSADNSQDYILDQWAQVNLKPLGIVDSIQFNLESSDVGMYGINTPTFFCLDNLGITIPAGISSIEKHELALSPNPATELVNFDLVMAGKTATIHNTNGQLIAEITINANGIADISSLESGMYIITISDEQSVYTNRFIKQ